MTLQELAVEKAGLEDQKEWLESRLRDIEIDLAMIDNEVDHILADMEKELKP
jgi:hypothetical protein